MKTPRPNYRLRIMLVFLALVALAFGSSSVRQRVAAQEQASVTTDKSDYSPGETVTISGSGWQAGETVALTIVENDGDGPWNSSATADDSGNISNAAFVIQDHDGGVSFTLTATGDSSGQTATELAKARRSLCLVPLNCNCRQKWPLASALGNFLHRCGEPTSRYSRRRRLCSTVWDRFRMRLRAL